MHMRNELLPPTLTPFTQKYAQCGQDKSATRPPHAGRVYQLGDEAGLYTGIVLGCDSIVRAEMPIGSGNIQQLKVGAMRDIGVVSVKPAGNDLLRQDDCAETGSVCVGTEFNVIKLGVYRWASR